ncbi:MAG: chitobiase/beta-hexosaminidase C-terminal domain-containing protein [Bryobacteraceae bacterium]
MTSFFQIHGRCLCPLIVLISLTGSVRATDVLTARYDNARTGQNLSETTLTRQNVNVQSFGLLYNLPVDGRVYAQTLYKSQLSIPGQGVHNVLFVATEHDSVYAFDADGNNPVQGYLWKDSFINPANGITTVLPTDVGTIDIVPEIGITSTPVIDGSTNTLYVVAKTKETSSTGTVFVQRLHALDLTSGAEKMNGPVEIQASVPGTGAGSVNGIVDFNPLLENQRASLLLLNGVVYIPWGAHGDQGNYHGWVIGYQAENVQQQTGAVNTTPNGIGAGVWMSGGGISADSAGNIYVAAGNGTYSSSSQNYGESALRLSTASGLSIADSFTPDDQDLLTQADNDMGVSDALILPDQPGAVPHLLITADKSGSVYVIDRDSMGGYNATSNANLQTLYIGSTIHNNISLFNNSVYIGGDGNSVAAYALINGVLSGNPTSQTANTFGQNASNGSGTSPIISANGTSNAIVWALNNFSNGTGPGILYAYDATNLATLLYSSNQAPNNRDTAGNAVKFTAPTVVNGKVYVPGVNTVSVYGLLGTGATQATADPTFDTPTNTIFSTDQSVTLSDTTPNAVIYYTTDGSVPTSSSLTYNGPVQITGPTTINAFAQAPGFAASRAVSAFYSVQSASIPPIPEFSNGFSSTGLALNGTATMNGSRLRLTDGGTFEAGSAFYTTPVNVQYFTTEFQFQLSAAAADGFTFTIQGDGPNAIGSTGGGLGYGPDPLYHISYGERSISNSVAVKFDLYNDAGEGPDSTGIYENGAEPTIPAVDLLSHGIDLHNGDIYNVRLVYDGTVLTLTITDTANPAATFSTPFTINIPAAVGGSTAYVGFTGGSGGLTAIQEILSWSFNPVPDFSSGFTGAGFTLNNGAALSGTRLRLTDGGAEEARSAYYSTPVDVESFTADFQFQLSNAIADGFTFVLQNQGLQATGAAGGGLGYGTDVENTGSGISNSVALKFDLWSNAGEGPDSTGVYLDGASPEIPAVNLVPSGINLHSGDTFSAHVTYDGANLALLLTDLQTMATYTGSFAVNIPVSVGSKYAYVGFTAGTGALTAIQDILSFSYSNPAQ